MNRTDHKPALVTRVKTAVIDGKVEWKVVLQVVCPTCEERWYTSMPNNWSDNGA